MKGLSLWHENARLDESRTLPELRQGAGAASATTERDEERAAGSARPRIHINNASKRLVQHTDYVRDGDELGAPIRGGVWRSASSAAGR